MNKRQTKKFKKKLYNKKYINYRRKYYYNIAYNNMPSDTNNNIVLITTTKKGNFKHIHNLSLLTNTYPVAINSSTTEINNLIKFKCSKLKSLTLDELANYVWDNYNDILNNKFIL